MNEIEETYESIGCQNEHRIRHAAYSQTNNQFYTLPLRSRLAPVNEYDIPLTNRPQAKSQTDASRTDGNDSVTYLANNQGVKNKCTKNCLIVISVFLALHFVLTSAAFCFSILKDEIIPMQSESAQHSASSGSEESVNQTHLLNEINMLKIKLNKLATDAMNNNQVNNYTQNSYQNCHQQTSLCHINTLINDNKRLYCNTGRLTVNKTVSKIKQSKYNSVE